MDESLRDIRARRFKSSTQENVTEPEPDRTFNFAPSKKHVSDEEVMRRQLNRKSVPYAWASEKLPGSFPHENDHKEEPPSTQAESEKKPTPTKAEAKEEPTSTDQDEKTCRICLSTQTPEERLISPCKCRGTSKWIHLSCLNQWRRASRNSKSYYRCDQCHYEYSFRRTDLAELLLSQYTLFALTAITFTIAMFFGGFVVKLGLYMYPPERMIRSTGWFSSFFYTPFDAGTDMLSAASALVPTTPRHWREIFVIDVWHFFQGFISLGIIGVVGFLGTGGLFSLRTFMPNGRRRRQQGDGVGLGELAFIVVLLLGCSKVAHVMWKRVRELVKVKLAVLGERILEVDPDQT